MNDFLFNDCGACQNCNSADIGCGITEDSDYCGGCDASSCESCQSTCEKTCQNCEGSIICQDCQSGCEIYFQGCGNSETSCAACDSESYCSSDDSCATNACQICQGCQGAVCESACQSVCEGNCETLCEKNCETTCEKQCQDSYDSPCDSSQLDCVNCEGNTCLSNACQSACQSVCLSVCQDNLDSCDNRQSCISDQECGNCNSCDACMTLCQEGDSGCTEAIPCNESSCDNCVSGQADPPCNQETPTPCTCQSAQVSCCSENVDSPDCDDCEYIQGGGTGECSSIQNSQGPSICNNDQESGEENEGGSSSGCGQSAGSGDIPVITPTSPNTEGWLRVNNQRFSPYTTWEKIQPKISNDNKDAKLINYHPGSSLDSLELLLDGSIIFVYD